MTNPDAVVTARGEAATLSRVTAVVYDAHGTYSEALSTVTSTAFQCIVSVPRQRELPPSMAGQEALRITVLSTLDVRADRPGRRDRVSVRGRTYEVIETHADKHPLTGIAKQTVLLAQLPIPQGT